MGEAWERLLYLAEYMQIYGVPNTKKKEYERVAHSISCNGVIVVDPPFVSLIY